VSKPTERWFIEYMGGEYPSQYVYIGGERVHENGDRSSYCVGQIDVCHKTEEARREAYRKARLAAAAPDLLAACKLAVVLYDTILDVIPHHRGTGDLLRAAIAKAEGGAA
jgi:hypothetical protein